MARHSSQYQVGSDTRSVESSPSFHGRLVTSQPSEARLRSVASLPCTPQPNTSSTSRSQGIASPSMRNPGEYTISPPSTSSSSTPSRLASSRSIPTSPWDESQQRRLDRVNSFSIARGPSHPTTPVRTDSEESHRSTQTQPPFHLRHRLKLALKEFFSRDPVDEDYTCQKIEDKHWTD